MVLSKWRLFLVVFLCALGVMYILPTFMSKESLDKFWPSSFPSKKVNLGLDLQGGSSILLEVDIDSVVKERVSGLLNEVRTILRKERIGYTGLKVESLGIRLKLRNPEDREKAYTSLRKFGQEVRITTEDDGGMHLELNEVALAERKQAVVKQSIEIVRRRIDEMGTKEPLIQRQGSDRILVQLPGIENPAEAKALIGKTAKMTFHLAHPDAGQIDTSTGRIPVGTFIAEEDTTRGEKTYQQKHVLQKQALITGEMLVDAQARVNSERGGWAVSFALDATGAKRFAETTQKNVGKVFAIILDGKVISAPVINGPIPSGSGEITGRFSAQEANELAMLLRAGALPAPLTVLEERTVGPDLGADSVAAGQNATIVACVLIFLFMFFVYGFSYGGIANIALSFNLMMLVSALALIQATLTLPGIAGIALTLGMAVDANVLIFERIKEELRSGKKTTTAINSGFHRAMSTIVDSNLTTLIAAGLLYQFGTGPIRGFAVTLALGILISMFTAVTATKTFIVLFYKLFGERPLSFGIKKGDSA